ncbi:MAG TPA: DUF599 family protein [Alphaproteobacteria bacterium]|nr:DUF599 family protein [Alphaproteobacteria bacterium]
MSFGLTPLDAAALVWFLFCWVGYTVWADYIRQEKSLVGATSLYRRAWMAQMLVRENRIVDTTLVGTLSRSSSFFAQTSIFILAGLIAVVGAQDVARVVVADLPFAQGTPAELWEIKLGLEIVIFVYSFFKFTWSLRQFNYMATLIGATPVLAKGAAPDEKCEKIARGAARMGDLAVNNFNLGIRAYYFGLAALAWFVQPWMFIVASAWVVLVLWRREFKSRTLAALDQ